MHHDDGRNGARARSARIRAGHDYEATALDTMRRRSAGPTAEPEARASLRVRLRTAFARAALHRSPAAIAGEDVRPGAEPDAAARAITLD